MPSPTETELLQVLRHCVACTFESLASQLRLTRRTIRRVLRQRGYYSSINLNSAWVTLAETPRFNCEGLWYYEDACFSSHRYLKETVKALIDQSPQGRTVAELQQRVRTRVHQTLGKCLGENEIGRFYLGRHAVYVSAQKDVAASQESRRRAQMETKARSLFAAKREAGAVPEGLDALTIIRVLVQMLISPQASVTSLSKTLQAQQVDIDAERIRRIIAFYDLSLKKKRRTERAHSDRGTGQPGSRPS